MTLRRGWVLGIGLIVFAIFCGGLMLALSQALTSPPEVRPPYPGSELLTTHSEWNVRGLRTVRSYRVDSNIRTFNNPHLSLPQHSEEVTVAFPPEACLVLDKLATAPNAEVAAES